MVLKELDPFGGGPDELADRMEADKLAYYLRRHYRLSNSVDVLNGVRVLSGSSMARVDHLLLHEYGMLVLLREPARGRMRVDLDGQWFREQGDGWTPMASPITHAYVQALLLNSQMDRKGHQRGFFNQMDLDVLIVLDDGCVVNWPTSGPLDEVCMRDDVHDHVERQLTQCLNSATRPGPLNEAKRRTLCEFLCAVHQPLGREGRT
ncbi:MAG: nuclease-related domain-containing protein [Burkholderiaceae bacterium]